MVLMRISPIDRFVIPVAGCAMMGKMKKTRGWVGTAVDP